jgi:lipooligosaccharide transport system permease protein
MRVYSNKLFSNGMAPFFEPLLFLLGVGVGLGSYINQTMDGLTYIAFLGMGLPMTSAMNTASFECTFGTFFRMEYQKSYEGILAAPISAENVIVSEMLWAGTKGLFFSFAVLTMIAIFGIVSFWSSLLIPIVGFFTGLMFGALGLLVTSFVKTINHFNFYLTGIISPMFFFSGVVFPISHLPPSLQTVAEFIPLTHSVRLARAIGSDNYHTFLLFDLLYIFVFILIIGFFAVKRLKKRFIL